MLFLQLLVCDVCYSSRFLVSEVSVLFLQVIVCEVCYSYSYWSVKCVNYSRSLRSVKYVVPPGFWSVKNVIHAGFLSVKCVIPPGLGL